MAAGGKKTLSLVSFNSKGTYNNVAAELEIRRLQQRQIPETIMRWVRDFYTDRRACILINKFTSDVQALPQAGLPQGSISTRADALSVLECRPGAKHFHIGRFVNIGTQRKTIESIRVHEFS